MGKRDVVFELNFEIQLLEEAEAVVIVVVVEVE
jgi:hypothetical protein